MHTSNHIYHDNGQELNGFMAYDESLVGSRPAVLVVHDWSGRNEFACEKAKLLAQLGYVGFAVDMYGHAQLGSTVEEKQALMNPLVADQSLLRRRIQAGLAAACSLSEVDSKRVAIIGFVSGACVPLNWPVPVPNSKV